MTGIGMAQAWQKFLWDKSRIDRALNLIVTFSTKQLSKNVFDTFLLLYHFIRIR